MENTKTSSMISRRGFIEAAAASSVAIAALPGVKVAAQSPRTTELKCDVVVMGTGVAGMTSAIRAQKADELAVPDGERQVIDQAGCPGVPEGHLVELEDGSVIR